MPTTRFTYREDERQRLDALSSLVAYLDQHGPPGVAWHYGRDPLLHVLGLYVSAHDIAGQLTVTPVWFLGPHRNDFVPIPLGEQVSFQVIRLHWRDTVEGAPYAYEHVLYGDAPHVLAAILDWRGSGSDTAVNPVPPLSTDELNRLRAIAEAGAAPVDVDLDFDPSSPSPALTTPAREALVADVANVSPLLLARHLPRDEQGRLALGATALLASYESVEPLGGKSAWLAALTPSRRRDPQVVRLSLRDIARGPYAYTWDSARWLWDSRSLQASREAQWGVRDLDIGCLGLKGRVARIQKLSRRCAQGGSLADQVALCILLQDEGRLEEAFGLFGITLSDEITRLVHGLPISGYLGTNLHSWVTFVRHQLRSAAPWLMPEVLAAEVSRRTHLNSKPRRTPKFRLVALPHQSSRVKRSLMLVARKLDGTEPALEIEDTGWDYRLPEPSWKRPLEIDLLRFGLLDPQ